MLALCCFRKRKVTSLNAAPVIKQENDVTIKGPWSNTNESSRQPYRSPTYSSVSLKRVVPDPSRGDWTNRNLLSPEPSKNNATKKVSSCSTRIKVITTSPVQPFPNPMFTLSPIGPQSEMEIKVPQSVLELTDTPPSENTDIPITRSVGSMMDLTSYTHLNIMATQFLNSKTDTSGLLASPSVVSSKNVELPKEAMGNQKVSQKRFTQKICSKSVQCLDSSFRTDHPAPQNHSSRPKSLFNLKERKESLEQRGLLRLIKPDGKPGKRKYLHVDEFKYKLNKDGQRLFIGQGNVGMVFLGSLVMDDETLKPACLKAASSERAGTIEQEFTALRKLQDTGLVPYAYGIISDTEKGGAEQVGAVIDFVPGISVYEAFKTGLPLTMQEWTKLILWVANALKTFIANDVLVNDFKCDSVVLNPTENGLDIKIIDFSHSSDIWGIQFSKMDKNSRGRHRHIAPEVYAGKFSSAASDVYSFGVFVWQILVFGTIKRNKTEKTKDVEEYNALVDIVKQCKKKYPPLRITFDEIIDRLTSLLG